MHWFGSSSEGLSLWEVKWWVSGSAVLFSGFCISVWPRSTGWFCAMTNGLQWCSWVVCFILSETWAPAFRSCLLQSSIYEKNLRSSAYANFCFHSSQPVNRRKLLTKSLTCQSIHQEDGCCPCKPGSIQWSISGIKACSVSHVRKRGWKASKRKKGQSS